MGDTAKYARPAEYEVCWHGATWRQFVRAPPVPPDVPLLDDGVDILQALPSAPEEAIRLKDIARKVSIPPHRVSTVLERLRAHQLAAWTCVPGGFRNGR